MKLQPALLLLVGTTLTAILAGAFISYRPPASVPQPSSQTFEVVGQIRTIEPDGLTAHIAHEEIHGYMPAMEMPFSVKNPELLLGLVAGDRVKFQLIVTKDDSWISRLIKIQSAKSLPSGSVPVTTTASLSPLQPGEYVPDFTLVDDSCRNLRLRDLRGKAVVLTFIYTRCPLPNFCPLMSRNFASLQERFKKHFPGKAHLLSISFDPEFDTPAILSRYGALYQQEPSMWTFTTGTSDQIERVAALFGLVREPANGFISHDLRTALIGPEGKLVHIWRSNAWTPYEIERRVEEILAPAVAATK